MRFRSAIASEARRRRTYWVGELAKLTGSFGDDSARMIVELRAEIRRDGVAALVDHLRLCGAVPEHYPHDSSEEKLYSKYTDALVSEAFAALGLRSVIVTTRADAADVQARCAEYSLVADAKAFRLSRTAKNQKDFKVQAMDGWRAGLDYAIVVCPIYQLPTRTSQIYQQAIARNVCVIGYSHLAALVTLAQLRGQRRASSGLKVVLDSVRVLNPSKSAVDYWKAVNSALLSALTPNAELWEVEKSASLDALSIVKEEALKALRGERDRLLRLTHEEALDELIRSVGLDARIAQVERVEHGVLLES